MKLVSRYVTIGLGRSGGAVPVRVALKAGADTAGKAVTLVITVAAARTLVADAFGVMALAMTTGWVLGVATDMGLSMFLARETARHPGRARNLLRDVMVLRTGLAYTAAALIALFSSRLVPGHWRLQFLLVVLAQLTGAVLDTLAHLFRGLERSEIEAGLQFAQRSLTAVLGLSVLYWWPRLDYLGAALLAPPLLALIASAAIAWYLVSPLPASNDTASPGPASSDQGTALTLRRLASDVLPLGAGALISALYFRCDLFFVEHWHGLEAAGAYNAVFRLVEAMRLVPAAVMAVTFPLLCRATDTRLVQRIGGWLTGAGVVLLAITAATSPLIVRAVYGEPFLYAAPSLSVLALALPFFFLNYALTHQVIGWDGHGAYLRLSTLALAGNLVANLMLVPPYGLVGAAIATVLTELIVTAGCVHALWAGAVLRPADGTAGSR